MTTASGQIPQAKVVGRATWIYVVMGIIFAAGLWLILHVGARLQAPPYVGGDWIMHWEQEDSALPGRMNISQSGRFLSARFAREHARNDFDGRLASTNPPVLNLHRDGELMEATLLPESQTLRGVYESGARRPFVAIRQPAPPTRP